MMSINYKTRNGESLQGKLKIFLYCSEADFNPWFHKISEKVLEVFDCAVLYPSEDGSPLSESFFRENVQLLMVLITKNSIQQADSALNQYLTDALKARLPVFFIRVEELDFDAFASQFDTLHCFDASTINSQNKQEIEHLNEQLQNKLYQFLANADEIEKIRSSFSAYIFLSYRKKDYHYVHQFMKLIHQTPGFRDIAIWFDDYLVPGEDFNLAIETSLKQSDAFTLLVTPNLLQDNNYVMNIEYPLAKEKNIPILPFEFIPTDRCELSEKYPNLPRCTDASDPNFCEAVLKRLIGSLGLRTENNSPEHLFLIGLAYLLGIDTEKNGSLARELIEKSISGGYHEGALKLAQMYAEGNGIPKDYAKAIFWLETYLTGLSDIHVNVGDSADILNNERRSAESETARVLLRKQASAVTLLTMLYEKTDTFNAGIYPYMVAICKEVLHIQLAYHVASTPYTTVCGYEKVKGPDGKWKLGPAIHKTVWATTGLLIDWEFVYTLHALAFQSAGDIPTSRRLDFLETICEAYQKMIEMADMDTLFNPTPVFREKFQEEYASIIKERNNRADL